MKKTLVIGASLNPLRYSNIAINRLVKNKIEVLAIGLRTGTVKNVTIINENKKWKDIHTITLYLNPKRQEEFYNYIVSLQPKRVIFNPGTENPELYKILSDNAIFFEIACTLVLLSTNQY